MNEKHREVKVWLEKAFGGEEVPHYEISNRTLDILHQLMQTNEKQDKLTDLIIEDLNQKTEEYNAEAERLKSLLHKVGLTPTALSQSGTVSLRTLANIGSILEVKDASDTSLLLGLMHARKKSQKLTDARKQEQKTASRLFEQTKGMLIKCQSLHKALDSLEEQAKCQGPQLEKKANQTRFLQCKAREYHSSIQDFEVELARSGVDRSLYHSTLLKKSQDLKQLREKLHPMKAKLDSYQNLPPDISLAKVKFEEMKREMDLLEEELTRNIDLMGM